MLLLAGATGAAVGLLVAGFEQLTAEVLLETVLGQPLWIHAAAPAMGLTVAAACVRAGGRNLSPATSDEQIRAFHGTSGTMELRSVPYRLAAAVATLGSGGPLGYEGPALYTGAGIGAALQRRLRRLFTAEDAKVLMVAGAAGSWRVPS